MESKRNNNRKTRRLKMLNAAADIYCKKGIDSASIQEVADRADMGVASVYRYFPTKSHLAIETAIHLWQQHMSPLLSESESNAIEIIEAYMNKFLRLFKSSPDFFRFIENFDNYISRQQERPASFAIYEEMLMTQDKALISLLKEGQQQGLIKENIDVEKHFSVAVKSIMAFAQKLLLRGVILQSDRTDSGAELKLMIQIMINSIKAEV